MDLELRGDVEIALRRQVGVDRRNRVHQEGVGGHALEVHAAEIAPLAGDLQAAPRRAPGGPELVTPLRAGRAAGRHAVETGAVELGDGLAARARARDARIVEQVLQVGAGQVERQAAVPVHAEVRKRHAVVGLHVDTAGLHETGVDVGADHIARGAQPQRVAVGCDAVDQRTERRSAVLSAGVQDDVRVQRLDDVVHLDVEVVDREGEARKHVRSENTAHREGVGLLRLQVRVAALQAVVLRSAVRCEVAVGRGRNPGVQALRLGVRRGGADTGVGVDQQGHLLGQIEFKHVRRPHRALVAGAEAEVVHGLPFTGELVGVGDTRRDVVREAIAGVQGQGLEEGHVLDDRDTSFAEGFVHLEGAALASGRAALAGQVARREFRVHVQGQVLTAIFGADRDRDLVGSPWALQRQGAVGRRAEHHFTGVAVLEAGLLDVIQGPGGDAADREDVVGHAAGVAGGARQGAAGVGDIQGVADVPQRHVVQELFRIDRAREQAVDVILPVAGDLALAAKHDAVVGVAKIVVTAAAFDVPAQQREGRRVRRAEARAGAEGGDFLGRQHRVATGDVEGLAEDAARGGLAGSVVVHEHQLRIGVEVVVHFVVGVGAGRIAFVRPLVVVHRTEVVGVGRGVVVPHGVARAALVDDEAVVGALQQQVHADDVHRAGGARPLAGQAGTGRRQGAGAVVAVRLQDRLAVLVAGEQGGVALAVGAVHADHEVGLDLTAVPDRTRGLEVALGRAQGVQSGVVVAVLEGAGLTVDPYPFEVLHHDEVDHAGDGVRAVHRRGAARQHFDVVDQSGRDEVDVRG